MNKFETKLQHEEISAIYLLRRKNVPGTQIADLFGVSRSYVSNIRHMKVSKFQQRKLQRIENRLARAEREAEHALARAEREAEHAKKTEVMEAERRRFLLMQESLSLRKIADAMPDERERWQVKSFAIALYYQSKLRLPYKQCDCGMYVVQEDRHIAHHIKWHVKHDQLESQG